MRLREATARDIVTAGEIQAACNRTDTMTRYFIRDMDKYPTTYRRSSVRVCKRLSVLPGAVTYVVETEPSDYHSANERWRAPEVVGFALWKRIGTSATAEDWKLRNGSGWFTALNGLLDRIEDRYLSVFPSVDCTFRPDRMKTLRPLAMIPFDPEIFAEVWQLNLFFVLPEWQRRGVGRRLMQWGFDRATEEGVPIVVKSSALGAVAYRAYGFKSMGCIPGIDRLFDVTELGGEPHQMWCWEPEGCQGRWFDRGKEALERQRLPSLESCSATTSSI